MRHTIRRLALKRFALGYPPRKPNDTSLGDAINWEWIIHCAKQNANNVVIVTRDEDYGRYFQHDFILNDWLSREFKQRVSRKRTITLTNKLSKGLQAAGIRTTKAERASEDTFLQGQPFDFSWPAVDAIHELGTDMRDAARRALPHISTQTTTAALIRNAFLHALADIAKRPSPQRPMKHPINTTAAQDTATPEHSSPPPPSAAPSPHD